MCECVRACVRVRACVYIYIYISAKGGSAIGDLVVLRIKDV